MFEFRDCLEEDRNCGDELSGCKISIYWDGDNVYYPGTVISFDSNSKKHSVVYDNDDSNLEYEEDLLVSQWKVLANRENGERWKGNIPVLKKTINHVPEERPRVTRSHKKSVSESEVKQNYVTMVVDAVYRLGEKGGSSLPSIRKYVQQNYTIRKGQFNTLTMKAINKAIDQGSLIRIRNTFKLSNQERERRREIERKACGIDDVSTLEERDNEEGLDFHGTLIESNRELRHIWENLRENRDRFLIDFLPLLLPFLPEKNYFWRKFMREVRLSVVQNRSPPKNPFFSVTGESSSNFISLPVPLPLCQRKLPMYLMPSIFLAKLHEHQIQGINWMLEMFHRGMPMILGDQMGLGKTIQAIGFLASLHEVFGRPGPYLIICPLSVISNWLAELDRFCPSFQVVRFHGPKSERARIKAEEMSYRNHFDVVVTSFEMLVSEINYFRRRFVWTAVIVDEGHRLKNEKSQFSEKVRLLPTLSKVVLTGTPLQNNLRELWSLLHYLSPEIFTSKSAPLFEEGFDLLRNRYDRNILLGAQKLLSVFLLRRLKSQVHIPMPSLKVVTLLVPLTETQKRWYRKLIGGMSWEVIGKVMSITEDDKVDMNVVNNSSPSLNTTPNVDAVKKELSENVEDIQQENKSFDVDRESYDVVDSQTLIKEADWRQLMNLLLQLRKVCNHCSLLRYSESDDEEETLGAVVDVAGNRMNEEEEFLEGSGKIKLLDRILPRLKGKGHRVLIFSQFTSMLDILEEYCELRDYAFVRLDGNTNRVQRRLDIRRFNAENSDLFIFLISTRAGGLGLNLASADTVILYDSDWNPQVDLQAMERAHRIGQTKPVRVYRFVCQGSIEERMVSRAEKKILLNDIVTGKKKKVSEASEQFGHSNNDDCAIDNLERAETSAELAIDDGDENEGEDIAIRDNENEVEMDDNDWSHALGVGVEKISKAELGRLIRFGSTAALEGYRSRYLSDIELDELLEINGRDIPLAAKDTLETQSDQASSWKQHLQPLQEVDLRQLGSLVYTKKKENKRSRKRKSEEVNGNDLDELDNNDIEMEEVDSGDTAVVPSINNENDTVLDVAASDVDEEENSIYHLVKRKRQERIVYVKTEYGMSVPILQENLVPDDSSLTVSSKSSSIGLNHRGRQWKHQNFCCLCGLRVGHKSSSTVNGLQCDLSLTQTIGNIASNANDNNRKGRTTKGKKSRMKKVEVVIPPELLPSFYCSHCPKSFHDECWNKIANSFSDPSFLGGNRTGSFLCPQHRCGLCNRSTAASGGLLFRCIGCMMSYCEDCLPQDEIESIGRCKELEKVFYFSKQAYYIRCPSCQLRTKNVADCSSKSQGNSNNNSSSSSSSSSSSNSSSSSSSATGSENRGENEDVDVEKDGEMEGDTYADEDDDRDNLSRIKVLLCPIVPIDDCAADKEKEEDEGNIDGTESTTTKNRSSKKKEKNDGDEDQSDDDSDLFNYEYQMGLCESNFEEILASNNNSAIDSQMFLDSFLSLPLFDDRIPLQEDPSIQGAIASVKARVSKGRYRSLQSLVEDIRSILRNVQKCFSRRNRSGSRRSEKLLELWNRCQTFVDNKLVPNLTKN